MPSEKTKKLLEGLGKITDSAPKPFQHQKYHSYTNRFYSNFLHWLPALYDKAKAKKDEDGDEIEFSEAELDDFADDVDWLKAVLSAYTNTYGEAQSGN